MLQKVTPRAGGGWQHAGTMLPSLRHHAGSVAATLLGGLLLACAATQAEAQSRRYEFEVLLDSRPIGTHRFEIADAGGGAVQVTSDARFDVRLLGITAYRYRHRAAERWEQGCLAGIDSETSDNGRVQRVRGARSAQGFRVDLPATRDAGSCPSSYAYWDRQLLLRQKSLLNPQTGEIDAVRIEPAGSEVLQVRGREVPAERYRLHGPRYVIDLWYAPSGEWLQLESTTDSKRRLRYRLTPPAVAAAR